MGGRTGGTSGRKVSAAAAAMRLDFPVPRSPTTAIRTPVRATDVGPAAGIDSGFCVSRVR